MFSLIKSGMATAMHELSVVSNNIANANSNGFKKTLVAFSELGDGLVPNKLIVQKWSGSISVLLVEAMAKVQ